MTNKKKGKRLNRESMTDEENFAATIYMEARGESEEGQSWVAWVINRDNRF